MRRLYGLPALAIVLGSLTGCVETDPGSDALRADTGYHFYDRPRPRGRDD